MNNLIYLKIIFNIHSNRKRVGLRFIMRNFKRHRNRIYKSNLKILFFKLKNNLLSIVFIYFNKNIK